MTRAAVALVLTALLGFSAIAREPFPYDLAILLDSVEDVGRESLREEAYRLLVWELENEGCYRNVYKEGTVAADRGPDEGRLALRVTLLEVVEDTSWDMSLAQRDDPRTSGGNVNTSQVARVSARFRMQLATAAGAEVRSKTVRISKAFRPRFQEDPRLEARQLMLDEAVRNVRLWACKGSPAKLARELRKARSATIEPSHGD